MATVYLSIIYSYFCGLILFYSLKGGGGLMSYKRKSEHEVKKKVDKFHMIIKWKI